MRRAAIAVLAGLLVAAAVSRAANLAIQPTTTLAAETGNNTSTANSFAGQTNGNLPAGNVSKVPIASLLYAGANSRIYVHFMGWWCGSGHVQIGYCSNDAAQVRRQVDDMMSRGIRGAIVDWYGPNRNPTNQATIYLMQESELRGGAFEFGITEDVGALSSCAATAGCDLSQQVINDLTYAYNNFMVSPAYMRWNGRPLVFFFGLEKYTLDWDRIRAGAPGNPLFIFRNSGAFTKPQTDGGFAWVNINTTNPNDIGLSYLDNFYAKSLSYPSLAAVGATYKGFNDSIAGWAPSPPRVMYQRCGQTWLETFAEMGKYFSANNQLDMLQLVTWNDYEEGTSLEDGIDNCVAIAASLAGKTLSWTVTGAESTIDHFTVFISLDGQNLMSLADVPASARSFDLSTVSLGPASYTLYVKAVGRPSMSNRMTGAVSYAIGNQAPLAALSVNPLSGTAPLQVTASTSASSDPDGSIASSSIDFGDGTVLTGPIATHTYMTAGSYTVAATVTDNLGATASSSAQVTAAGGGVTMTSPLDGGSYGSTVRVMASATSGLPIVAMKIYLDYVAVYTTAASSFDTTLSLGTGQHRVVSQAWDSAGTVYKATAVINVTNQAPVARLSVSPTSGVAPLAVSASTAASSDADGSIASSTISFGDGTVAGGPAASHTYATPGTYTVTATVTDSGGATATTSQLVSVTAPGVTISTPVNGGKYKTPVHVVASATGYAPITTMRVYADNVSVYEIAGNAINAWIAMPRGPRSVVVQAWDANGTVYQSAVNINVR